MSPAPLRPPGRWSRRQVLQAGAVAAAALAVAGCSPSDDDSRPDPLLALASAARADAATARRVAASYPDLPGAAEVADARERQARALQHEIDRAAGGQAATPSTPPATSHAAATVPDRAAAARSLSRSLHTAQQQAAKLVPTLPRYRAGLVASVSAGCAALHGVLP